MPPLLMPLFFADIYAMLLLIFFDAAFD